MYAMTQNGAASYGTTGSSLLDFFANAGSMRLKQTDVSELFRKALLEHQRYALQMALWLRDARGGAGERESFRTILRSLDSNLSKETLRVFLAKVPLVGRWDDLLVIEKNYDIVNDMFKQALAEKNGLWAKWMPVKGIESVRIRRGLNMDARTFRKTVVAMRKTIEQDMCARRWDAIEPAKVPGLALNRYTKALFKHVPETMLEFKNRVKSGEVKIKTDTMYPYDVIRLHKSGSDRELVQATWEQLPDYLGDAGDILPIIDVSSSMSCPSGAAGFSCMDIAIGLGLYVTQRQKGPFKDTFLTFSSAPMFRRLPAGEKIGRLFDFIRDSQWGGSTDLQKTFDLILQKAKELKCTQEQLPSTILLISDMQFNLVEGYYRTAPHTNLQAVSEKFEEAGYKMPKLVFWQVNGNKNDTPATMEHQNVSMFSGFSASILKAALKDEIVDPSAAMLETIDTERYRLDI